MTYDAGGYRPAGHHPLAARRPAIPAGRGLRLPAGTALRDTAAARLSTPVRRASARLRLPAAGLRTTADYGPPGYRPAAAGVQTRCCSLRPLTLSDMFNGAVAYIRANPKATLGLTTIVVVAAQLLSLALSLVPFAFTGELASAMDSDEPTAEMVVSWVASSITSSVSTFLSGILLTGLLTVVVGRAIFGAGITIGEAWQRFRPRLWALIGFTVLQTIGAIVLVAIATLITVGVIAATDGLVAFLICAPLWLALVGALVYLGTMLTFAPVAIVLERRDIISSIKRSFVLINGDFWRVLGIRLLAAIVASLVAGAVAIPFSLGGQIALTESASTTAAMIALVLFAVGGAIGQIVTGPFSAGVIVLQYTDRRIRSEAFDFVLHTGAAAGPAAPANSTDDLWLTRQN